MNQMKFDLSKFKDVLDEAPQPMASLNGKETRPWRNDETEKNLEDERLVAELIEAEWNVTVKKLPRLYHLDFVLLNKAKKIRGFAEIKIRDNPQLQYAEYMIGLSKVLQAKKLTEFTGQTCVVIVRWTDFTGWISLREYKRIGWGGRTGRDDFQDLEPMAFFTASAFKAL